MNLRVRLLRALTDEGLYTVDERAVADAMLARVLQQPPVPDPRLFEQRASIRSFRYDRAARPFRLARPAVRRDAR